MSIIIKSPSIYVQGQNELANIGVHTKKMGTKFFILCSKNSMTRLGEQLEQYLKQAEKDWVFFPFAGECSKEEIATAMEACKASGCDLVLGMGGGKAVDTARAVADNLSLPVVIVPTIASNNAPCSGLSVIYNDAGVVIKAQFTKRNPDLVLVDTAILVKAPARFFVSGMGDALAAWFEARAAYASGAKSMARGQCSHAALMLSKLCYDILIKDGFSALQDVKKGEVSSAVERVVEANIYLSGIGFESGGLAAAHAVNDGFGHLPETHGLYHGEKVAFGTFVQLLLEKASKDELDAVMQFIAAVGLPLTLKQMGINTINEADLRKVAEAACVPTQFTKNLPVKVNAEDVYQAILEADRLGTLYLS